MDGLYWLYLAIGTINICAGACILRAEIITVPNTVIEIEMSLLNLEQREALLH
jgi:hypothetical protein